MFELIFGWLLLRLGRGKRKEISGNLRMNDSKAISHCQEPHDNADIHPNLLVLVAQHS
jgi:hypothetical protein